MGHKEQGKPRPTLAIRGESPRRGANTTNIMSATVLLPPNPSHPADVRRLIEAAFPGFAVASVRLFGQGWVNAAWIVNEEWLFRFPKNADASKNVTKEMRLLKELACDLPVPVPSYPFQALGGVLDYPWSFGGYRFIRGQPPLQEVPPADGDWVGLANPVKVAPVLASFLDSLHSFPVERAAALGVPGLGRSWWLTHYRASFARDLERLRPYLSLVEVSALEESIGGFLADEGNFAFQPVLVHHDLGPYNILVAPETGEITGVIDFEDAAIGDPAFDFTGILDLAPKVLDLYGGPRDSGFDRRIRFYRSLWPINEACYGIEVGSVAGRERGLKYLREGLDARR